MTENLVLIFYTGKLVQRVPHHFLGHAEDVAGYSPFYHLSNEWGSGSLEYFSDHMMDREGLALENVTVDPTARYLVPEKHWGSHQRHS